MGMFGVRSGRDLERDRHRRMSVVLRADRHKSSIRIEPRERTVQSRRQIDKIVPGEAFALAGTLDSAGAEPSGGKASGSHTRQGLYRSAKHCAARMQRRRTAKIEGAASRAAKCTQMRGHSKLCAEVASQRSHVVALADVQLDLK